MKNQSKLGTYYLGRVMFTGGLDKVKLVHALKEPSNIVAGDYNWTITDFKKCEGEDGHPFYYGKLSKYKPKGEVDFIDTKLHLEKMTEVKNAKVASSPFVFLPEYSGIAYLHVWNMIQKELFVRRFKELVEKKYDNFFIECNVEAVSDLATFYGRISALSSIDLIQAKVRPPNPLFGPLWESLKDYLKKRKVVELKIEEKAEKGKEILSNLKELITSAEKDPKVLKQVPDITDAAMLMATDGYGHGKLHGMEGKKRVVICTSDSIKNFKFDTEPDPEKLHKAAEDVFREISEKRHMEHDKPNN